MGERRRERRVVHRPGTPRNHQGAQRRRSGALCVESDRRSAHQRARDWAKNRRGPGAGDRQPGGNEPGASGRCAGHRHDRSRLGAGDEARGSHRHQSRRAHLPCGHRRARDGYSGGGGDGSRHHGIKGGRSGDGVVRRGRHREKSMQARWHTRSKHWQARRCPSRRSS